MPRLFIPPLSSWFWPLIAVAVFAALRLLYIQFGPLDLGPDEAQYWDWSRQLDWGYYSKPPLIAWLIAASTNLFDHTELAVRLPAILGQAALALLVFAFVRPLGQRWAWLGLVTCQLTPLLAAGGLLMTTDVPSSVAWLAALLMLSRVNWQQNGQWRLFIGIGLAIGLGGLAKLSVGAFYPLLGLFLLAGATRRRWLFKPQVYAAGFISLACLAPMVWWNSQNNWVSFRHVLGQASGDSTLAPLVNWSELLLSQLGVWGLISFALILIFWLSKPWRKETPLEQLLWWFSLPLFAGFMLKGIDAKIQANWPLLASLTGLVALLVWLPRLPRFVHILFLIGLIPSAVLTVLLHNTNLVRELGMPLKVKIDPLKPLLGWQNTTPYLQSTLQQLPASTVLFTTRYQTASQLAFYAPGQPQVHYLNPGYRRFNQYDLWPWPNLTAASSVLYVNEQNKLEPAIAERFAHCATLPPVQGVAHGLVYRQLHLFHCTGYKGAERPLANSY